MRCMMNSGMERVSMLTAGVLLMAAGGVATGSPDAPAPPPAAPAPLITVHGDVIENRSIRSVMSNAAGDTVEIKIEGVDAEVIVNGASVGKFKTDGDWTERSFGDGDAAVRITKKPGGMLLIEQDGSTMQIGGGHGGFGGVAEWLAAPGVFLTEDAVQAFGNGFDVARTLVLQGSPFETPKVMLGVTMGPASPDQAMEFGFDPAKATVIGSVIDGLPAANAGLRPGDIVVGIGDSDEAGEKSIREQLSVMEPGDVLTLKIIRGGEVTAAGVKLEAYDAARLGVQDMFQVQIELDDPEFEALRARQSEVKKRLVESMNQAQSAQSQRARDRANAEAQKLNAELQDVTAQIAKRMAMQNTARIMNNTDGAQIARQWLGDQEGNVFVIPQQGAELQWQRGADGAMAEQLRRSEELLQQRDARIQELEGRLDEMTRKLDRLEAILQELKDR